MEKFLENVFSTFRSVEKITSSEFEEKCLHFEETLRKVRKLKKNLYMRNFWETVPQLWNDLFFYVETRIGYKILSTYMSSKFVSVLSVSFASIIFLSSLIRWTKLFKVHMKLEDSPTDSLTQLKSSFLIGVKSERNFPLNALRTRRIPSQHASERVLLESNKIWNWNIQTR